MLKKPIVIENKLSKAGIPNLNGHVFPASVIEKAVDKLQNDIEQRRVLGRIGIQNTSRMSLSTASHLVTFLWVNDGRLNAEIEILDTKSGRLLQNLLENKSELTLHPKWIAELNQNNQIKEGASLISVDICLYDEAIVPFEGE